MMQRFHQGVARQRVPRRLQGSRRRPAGFTLLEILVLLALFSIMVAVSFPAVRLMMAEAKLESTVQRTATVFYSARLQAIREATTARVEFEEVEEEQLKRIWATIDRNRDGDFNTHLGDVQMNWTMEFTGPPSDDDGIVGFADERVEFRSDGTVAEPGAIRIAGYVGEELRYYEVRVGPAAAPRISIREWDPIEDEWVEEGDD